MSTVNMIRRTAAALAVAAVVFAAMTTAASAAIDLGTLTADNPSADFVGKVTSTASTTFDYTFTVATAAVDNYVNITASPVKGSVAFSSLATTLYSGTTALTTATNIY